MATGDGGEMLTNNAELGARLGMDAYAHAAVIWKHAPLEALRDGEYLQPSNQSSEQRSA